MNNYFQYFCIALLGASWSVAFAEEADSKKTRPPVILTVDDLEVRQDLLDQYEQFRRQQTRGAPTSREQLIEDIINNALLANEFDRMGLDQKDTAVQMQLMIQKASMFVRTAVTVSDQEIEALYNSTIKKQGVESFLEMEYHTRHILLKTEQEAIDIIKKLNKDRDSFSQLAKEFSEDKGSGSAGGDLGWFKPKSLVKPYSDAMQSLKVGELTEKPVESQFGWHVIELLEKPRKGALPTLESEKPRLNQQLFQSKLQAYLMSLRKKAKIKIEPIKAGDGSK